MCKEKCQQDDVSKCYKTILLPLRIHQWISNQQWRKMRPKIVWLVVLCFVISTKAETSELEPRQAYGPVLNQPQVQDASQFQQQRKFLDKIMIMIKYFMFDHCRKCQCFCSIHESSGAIQCSPGCYWVQR